MAEDTDYNPLAVEMRCLDKYTKSDNVKLFLDCISRCLSQRANMAAMSPFVINLTRHKEASQRADYGSIKISIRANGSTSGQATERAEQTASQVSALCHALVC